jgi:protein involved in polysaccharide export with SLBB domain
MKTLLFVAVSVWSLSSCFFSEGTRKIEVTVIGAVRDPGSKSINTDCSLVKLLNDSGCTKASYTKRIQIIRKRGSDRIRIQVEHVPAQEANDGKIGAPFQLEDGDVIDVPETLFDPSDETELKTVGGYFVVRKLGAAKE